MDKRVKFDFEIFNGAGARVMTLVTSLMMQRRASGSTS